MAFYNNVKPEAKQYILGAKVINDDLAERFTYKSRKMEANLTIKARCTAGLFVGGSSIG
jgi:hypothetical protein